MFMCVKNIDLSLSTTFLLDFGTIPTVWYLFFFQFLDISGQTAIYLHPTIKYYYYSIKVNMLQIVLHPSTKKNVFQFFSSLSTLLKNQLIVTGNQYLYNLHQPREVISLQQQMPVFMQKCMRQTYVTQRQSMLVFKLAQSTAEYNRDGKKCSMQLGF